MVFESKLDGWGRYGNGFPWRGEPYLNFDRFFAPQSDSPLMYYSLQTRSSTKIVDQLNERNAQKRRETQESAQNTALRADTLRANKKYIELYNEWEVGIKWKCLLNLWNDKNEDQIDWRDRPHTTSNKEGMTFYN